MNDEIVIPRNKEAEQAVIGSVIQASGPFIQARRLVVGADFYDPAHELIWNTCEQIYGQDLPIEPMRVMQTLLEANELARIGGSPVLANLIEAPWVSVNVEHWARTVHEVARARRIVENYLRMGQVLAENPHDHDAMLSGMSREALKLELLIDERAQDAPLDGLMHFSELWNLYPHESVEWLVPELLIAEDVFMLLAGEGGGKSWFTRQFVLCLAAGIHPFHAERRITPVRSLLVDLENAPAMVAYESHLIGGQVARLGDFNDELAQIYLKEDGLNLRDRTDQQLLERAVIEQRPQLLAIGSLYKAFRRDEREGWESPAAEVREYLDKLRRRYKVALLIEHHMPKGSGSDRPLNPYGALTWQQWPSVGQIIHRVGENMYQMTSYRGTRLKRELPIGLTRGGRLPWTPVWEAEDMRAGMWEEARKANRRVRPQV